jgi:SET domain-containing protein
MIAFKPSVIHGIGGFAIDAIPKGVRAIQYVGQEISKAESIERCQQGNRCIFYIDAERDLDGDVPWNPARLLNHSCAPNCDAECVDGGVWIVANRDIAAGEEITFNYNFDLVDYREYPCDCGSPNCVGYIVAEEFFAHLRTLSPLCPPDFAD